jgi:aminoglycoside phosphotransferase (APT) family kinase protein
VAVTALTAQTLADALPAWLAAVAGGEVRMRAARPLSGGAVQENWAVDVSARGGRLDGEHALVLRTDAPARMAASLDRREEYAVLHTAHTAGVTVPEPLFLCDDESVLGRNFYLMRRVTGTAAGHRLVRDHGVDGSALAGRLGEELGRLHAIRPPFPGLDFLQQPDPAPAIYRVNTYRAYLDEMGVARPVLEWALRWLERFAPRDETVALCHGDYRTGNYMVDGGALTGILDWEFAAWSHPFEDLGWFCARCWRFGRDEREAGGIAGREALYRGYESAAGVKVDHDQVRYWEVMATVRWAVLALQQGQRHVSGEQRSLELALTGRMVPELELDALDQVERLSGTAR